MTPLGRNDDHGRLNPNKSGGHPYRRLFGQRRQPADVYRRERAAERAFELDQFSTAQVNAQRAPSFLVDHRPRLWQDGCDRAF